MSRTIIVGDIHGSSHSLNQLIFELNIQNEDTFISLGDLLHKGPYGKECIDILRNLSCKVIFIFGNHEDKHYRWYIKSSEKRLQMTWVDNFEKENLTDKDIEWIINGYLYYSFEINSQKYICVHGGIAPEHIDLKESLLIKDLFKTSGQPKRSLEKILRIRYITPEGNSVKNINEITDKDIYWAEIYDGRFGTALFGHQPFLNNMGPRVFPYAIGLDNGCVHGGSLTALILENGASMKSISIKNDISYCPSIFTPHRFPI
jgi:serine/threonine protein phosphatase 1